MAQATQAQYQVAIDNYLRAVTRHRKTAETFREGDWRRNADLRVAYKAETEAAKLAYQQGQVAYEDGRRITDNPHTNSRVRESWHNGYDYANSFEYFN